MKVAVTEGGERETRAKYEGLRDDADHVLPLTVGGLHRFQKDSGPPDVRSQGLVYIVHYFQRRHRRRQTDDSQGMIADSGEGPDP